MRTVILLMALLGVCPARAEPLTPAAVRAQVQAVALPELAARQRSAEERVRQRAGYFGGAVPWEAAFFDLRGRNLDDPAVVAGLLRELDERAAVRGRERLTPAPGPLDRRLDARLRTQRERTLDAEDRADGLARRMLIGVQAHLQAHPTLHDEGLERLRQPLEGRIAAVRSLPEDASPEAREVADMDAATADLELSRLVVLAAALRRTALVPGAPLPDAAEELALLQEPLRAEAAAARLGLLQPFLGEEAASGVEAALAAWFEETRLARARAERAEAAAALQSAQDAPQLDAAVDYGARVGVLEAQLAEAEAEVARRGVAAEGPFDALQRQQAELVRDTVVDRLETARLLAGRAEEASQVAEQQARRAQEAADVAMEEAARAAELARDASERRAATLLTELAVAQREAAEAWSAARSFEEEARLAEQQHSEALSDLRSRILAAQEAGPLAADRPDPDLANRELRGLIDELRRDFHSRQEAWDLAREARSAAEEAEEGVAVRVGQERETISAIQPDELRASVEESLVSWAAASTDQRTAREQHVQALRGDSDALLRRLQQTRALRQENLPQISRDERSREQGFLISDITGEMGLMGPRLSVLVLDWWSWLQALPGRLLDFSIIRTLFLGSFWVIFVLAGWWSARSRSHRFASRVIERLAQRRVGLIEADLAGTHGPLVRAIETFLDLLVGWLVAEPITGMSPVVGLAISIYLHLALYRFISAVYELAFAEHPTVRPSLRTLRPESHVRLRRTIQLMLIWWIARNLTLSLLPDVLGLYTLAALARSGFAVAGVVVTGFLLYRWAPSLRAGVRRGSDDHPWRARLAAEPPLAVLGVFQAVAILVYGLGTGALGVLPRLVREGSGLGVLVSQVGHLQLGTEDSGAALPPLAPARRDAVLQGLATSGAMVTYEDQVAQAQSAFDAWWKSPRRGLVVLTGDRGAGKTPVVQTLTASFRDRGVQTRLLALEGRLRTRDELMHWFAEALELETVPDSEDALVQALDPLPRMVVVLEDLHRAFLRTVDGLEALRTLLYVMNATGDHLFWLATVHRPAWAYLSNLGTLLDTDVARAVIELPPLSERSLRSVLLGATQDAGVEPDFSRMARPGVFSDDPAVEEARASSLYFRVLRDASGGNPAVARMLWVDCLRAGASDELATVVLDERLTDDPVEDLDLPSALIVAAAVIHDEINPDELREATNLSAALLRSAIKDLVGRGVLEAAGTRALRVSTSALVPASRMLRRRNLANWTM